MKIAFKRSQLSFFEAASLLLAACNVAVKATALIIGLLHMAPSVVGNSYQILIVFG